MAVTLMPHQEKTVQFGLKNPYSIFALDMGLGKTVAALEIYRRAPEEKLLVVCPAYLTLNWANEVRKFYGDSFSVLRIRSKHDIPRQISADITIMSYEMAVKCEHLFEARPVVVIDEAQYLKSMKTKRTEAIHKYVFENSVPRLHLLSGTPIKNRVEEYYSLLALCHYRPTGAPLSDFLSRFENSNQFADYFSYRDEREIMVRNRRIKIVNWSGIKNTEELKSYLRPVYIRFSADKILDLPPIQTIDFFVSEDPDEFLLKAYKQADENNSSVMPKYKSLAALKKVPFTVDYLKNLQENVETPIIVYTDHRESCRSLGAAMGWPSITGETTVTQRAKLAEDFQAGKLPGLAATIGSFSTGVTLTRSRDVVFNDVSWVPGDNAQAIARIRRIGQTGTCRVHRVLGSPQDLYILESLEKKSKTIAKIL